MGWAAQPLPQEKVDLMGAAGAGEMPPPNPRHPGEGGSAAKCGAAGPWAGLLRPGNPRAHV